MTETKLVVDYNLAQMLLSNAIAEKGWDYIYEVPVFQVDQLDDDGEEWIDEETECAYFDADGIPSCGIGCAVAQLPGVTAELVDHCNIGVGAESLFDFVLTPRLGYDITEKAKKFFNVFQNYQDQGRTWGMAWAEAEEASYGRVEN